jgi:hypothetical protein
MEKAVKAAKTSPTSGQRSADQDRITRPINVPASSDSNWPPKKSKQNLDTTSKASLGMHPVFLLDLPKVLLRLARVVAGGSETPTTAACTNVMPGTEEEAQKRTLERLPSRSTQRECKQQESEDGAKPNTPSSGTKMD